VSGKVQNGFLRGGFSASGLSLLCPTIDLTNRSFLCMQTHVSLEAVNTDRWEARTDDLGAICLDVDRQVLGRFRRDSGRQAGRTMPDRLTG
jgi:hypothetical protein